MARKSGFGMYHAAPVLLQPGQPARSAYFPGPSILAVGPLKGRPWTSHFFFRHPRRLQSHSEDRAFQSPDPRAERYSSDAFRRGESQELKDSGPHGPSSHPPGRGARLILEIMSTFRATSRWGGQQLFDVDMDSVSEAEWAGATLGFF